MRAILKVASICLLGLMSCAALGGVIPNGGSISGEISIDGEIDTLTFTGTAGQRGVISISGDVVGGELYRVFNPDGTALANDGAQELLTLPQTGTYTVVVSSFQPRGTGNYTVHLALAPGANEHGLIPNGGSTSETIDSDGEIDSFTFTGTAGQRGVISISGDVVGGELYRVFNPDGTALANDGAQELLTLPQTGTYTVVVSSFQPRGTGNYTVHLALAPGANEHGLIPNGGSTSETIDSDGEIDSFTFEGLAGQTGTISVTGGVVGGEFIRVFTPSGQLLDSTGNQIALMLPETGTYTVVARSFQAAGTGNYTISLALDPVPEIEILPDPLSFGDVALGASRTEMLIIENLGAGELELVAFNLTGLHPGDFSIVGTDCPIEIAPGEFCGLEIAFSPPEPGVRTAQLDLFSNAPTSPNRVTLIGSNNVLFADGFEEL